MSPMKFLRLPWKRILFGKFDFDIFIFLLKKERDRKYKKVLYCRKYKKDVALQILCYNTMHKLFSSQ